MRKKVNLRTMRLVCLSVYKAECTMGLLGCDEVMTIDEFLSPVCTESPGMCKLDQESPLRPLSYHNQVIYARPVNNNTVIRHESDIC